MAKIDEVLSKKQAIAEAQKEIERRNKISKSSKGKKKKKKKLTKKEAEAIIRKHLRKRKSRKSRKKVVTTTQKKQKPIVLTDKEAKSLLQVNIQAKERRKKKPKSWAERQADKFGKTGIADLSQLRQQRQIASEHLGYQTQSQDPLAIRKAGRGRYNVGVPGVRGISREEQTGEFVVGGYTGLVAGSKVGQQVAGRRQLGRGQRWYEKPPEDDDIQIRGDSDGRQPPNQRKPRFSDSGDISVDIPPRPSRKDKPTQATPETKTGQTQTEPKTIVDEIMEGKKEKELTLSFVPTQSRRTPEERPSNVVGGLESDTESSIISTGEELVSAPEGFGFSSGGRLVVIQPPRSRRYPPSLSDPSDFESEFESESSFDTISRYTPTDSSEEFKPQFRTPSGARMRLVETIEPDEEEDIIGEEDDVGQELDELAQETRLEDEVRFREREEETRPENIPTTLPEGLRRPTGNLLTRQIPPQPTALQPTPENVRMTQPLTQRIADTIRSYISPPIPEPETRPIARRGRPRRDISTPNIEDKIKELEGQQRDLGKRIDAIKIQGKPFKMGRLNPSGDSPEQITEASSYIQEWIYNTNLDRFEKGQDPLSDADERDLEQSAEDLLRVRIELRRLRGLRGQRKKKK